MSTATVVMLSLPWPYKGLSPNARTSHFGLARTKKRYRNDCRVLALQVRNSEDVEYPLRAPVTARVVFSVPKGELPDEDNAIASFKAGWDGIVDAKLIIDDSPAYLHVEETLVMRGAKREVRIELRSAS